MSNTREFTVESGSCTLFGVEAGAGRAILMLHGGMASHAAVWPLVAPLTSTGRVIAPDVRGNGRSRWAGDLSFDQLADDVVAVLDHLGLPRAIVGGVSGGSGVALRTALRHPDRLDALVLVQPVYAGGERGLTEHQRTAFSGLDALASRAPVEGVAVLRPLYAALPEPMRTRALTMLETLDAASLAATSRFLASGAQPFESMAELRRLAVPTLIIDGDDPMHPAAVAAMYAAEIPVSTSLPAGSAVAEAIAAFAAGRWG